MTSLTERRKVLTDRLAELTARLREIDEELESHASPDWEDMAVEREEDEVLEQMGTSGKVEIAKINAALKRMEEGEYGYCVTCGDEISPERLDVLPHTPFCRSCAAAKAAS